jgi:hypothetical protein
VLQPISLHGVVSGAWAAMESIDIVFYEQHATPFHQQHIILHELSHILCEHQGFDFTEEGLRSLLLTDAPIERLRTLQSNHYSDEEEREAEMLASLILERVNNAQADNAIKDPNISGTLQWTQPYESPGILARSVASGYGKAMFCPHATRQRGIRATAEAV